MLNQNDADDEPHSAFLKRAGSIFSGSTIVHEDTYEQAKGRLLGCIREGAPTTPQIDRWALACEAAALSREDFGEPYKGWAQRLIDTDLQVMLEKFRAAGVDPLEETADPMLWRYRPIICSDVRRLIPILTIPTEFLGDPDTDEFTDEHIDT